MGLLVYYELLDGFPGVLVAISSKIVAYLKPFPMNQLLQSQAQALNRNDMMYSYLGKD